jgi:hypothetical protein
VRRELAVGRGQLRAIADRAIAVEREQLRRAERADGERAVADDDVAKVAFDDPAGRRLAARRG